MEPGRVCPCPFRHPGARRAHTSCSVRRKSGSAHSCGAGSRAVAPEVGAQPTSWTDARWPQGARWVLTDWAPTLDRALLTWCPGDAVLRAPGDRSRGRHRHRDGGVHRFRPKSVLLSSEWRFDRGLGRAAETRVACTVRAHTRPHRPQGRSGSLADREEAEKRTRVLPQGVDSRVPGGLVRTRWPGFLARKCVSDTE